jgi:hypothetical protein
VGFGRGGEGSELLQPRSGDIALAQRVSVGIRTRIDIEPRSGDIDDPCEGFDAAATRLNNSSTISPNADALG